MAPVNKHGGRELETGFVASVLSEQYEVKLLSTANYYKDAQVLDFGPINYSSLNKELFQKSWSLRLVIFFVSLLSEKIEYSHRSLSLAFVKKYFQIENKKKKLLKESVTQADLVFICAQVYSNYLDDIIDIATLHKIPVIFRTTGTINDDIMQLNYSWLNKVGLFVHHSEKNAAQLSGVCNRPYVVIDQCAYNEEELLNLQTSDKINRFFVLSRLSSEKQVHLVIKAFKNVCSESDFLHIFGDGPKRTYLESLANNYNQIKFEGQVSHQQIPQKVFGKNDCLIIASSEEAGPLTGIEAMASGTLLISTKVGAMNERLPEYKFWYDGSQKGLEEQILKIKELTKNEIVALNSDFRNSYLEKYSVAKLTEAYLSCVTNVLNTHT